MKVITTFCMGCKFYKPEASFCSYWGSSVESTGLCSEGKEKQKTVRGKKANWIGFGCDITPDEKLMAVKHDAPQPVIEWNGNYHCPKCEYMLSKNRKKKTDIRFCSKCGQEVKWDD